jgi:hypothetical protein
MFPERIWITISRRRVGALIDKTDVRIERTDAALWGVPQKKPFLNWPFAVPLIALSGP